MSEYKPEWKHFDDIFPPKGTKILFKADNGPAVIGQWYEGCDWTWWCSLPKHSELDKKRIKMLRNSIDDITQEEWDAIPNKNRIRF